MITIRLLLGYFNYFCQMKSILRDKYLPVRVVILGSILVPLAITTYELIILGKDSVIFLGEYPSAVGIIVIIYYILLLVAALIWLIKQFQSLLNIRNENRKNELLHLQSQVNPHFFFNMLNNIYGLVDKDTAAVKKIILKLSELMRYSIYEGEKNVVTISEEVTYLKNYIELHTIRYHKEITVQFHTAIEKENIKIRPLLLIILLENAFKHGVENLREKAYVHIDLKVNQSSFIFVIENNFDAAESLGQSGIGLNNLKRRLQLAYPEKHMLRIDKADSVYKAQLELQL